MCRFRCNQVQLSFKSDERNVLRRIALGQWGWHKNTGLSASTYWLCGMSTREHPLLMYHPGLVHAVFVRMFGFLGLWLLTTVPVDIKTQFAATARIYPLQVLYRHLRALTALDVGSFIIPRYGSWGRPDLLRSSHLHLSFRFPRTSPSPWQGSALMTPPFQDEPEPFVVDGAQPKSNIIGPPPPGWQ